MAFLTFLLGAGRLVRSVPVLYRLLHFLSVLYLLGHFCECVNV